MQVKVTLTKVLKTGEGAYGEWKLIKVTTESGDYTTFADGAETLTPGTVINISDMDKDDQERESFKKYEIVKAGKEQPSSKKNGSPSDPARVSIERQVAAKIAFEFTAFDVPKTLEIAEQIYQWISSSSPPQPTSSVSSPVQETSNGNLPDADTIKQICSDAGLENTTALNNWVKERYDGLTWGKLSKEKQAEVLGTLKLMGVASEIDTTEEGDVPF
ncbi:hypothetical protein LCGC14_1208120 [marine sediment metagenome]|uniref:Uncharacterized protein n=1 Tax=marine sediment metagenome TaxID=412755 RepID=A0A0F9M284_9ZZZZ